MRHLKPNHLSYRNIQQLKLTLKKKLQQFSSGDNQKGDIWIPNDGFRNISKPKSHASLFGFGKELQACGTANGSPLCQ